jgi:hypothetical protein
MIQIIIFMEKSFQWHCVHLLAAIHFFIFLMCLYFIFIQIPAIISRKLHWDPEDDEKRAVKWTELDKKSLNRLDDLICRQR